MPHSAHAPPSDSPTTTTPATPAPAASAAAAVELDLEARLAVVDATMRVALDNATAAIEVNTAHIPVDPVDLADVVTTPIDPVALPQPTLYPTPAAALLQRAHHRLLADGWCTGALVDVQGARCLWGAIRAEAAGDHGLETHALEVLMEAIRRKFGPDVESVPTFNDSFGGPRVPLRLLEQAASLADARGL